MFTAAFNVADDFIEPLGRDRDFLRFILKEKPPTLICTGSANFSENSLTSNDENMIVIRGSTRVADIYLTEFDRLFRHFLLPRRRERSRHETQEEGKAKEGFPGRERCLDQQLFLPRRVQDTPRNVLQRAGRQWTKSAATRSNDEPIRPNKKKKARKSED